MKSENDIISEISRLKEVKAMHKNGKFVYPYDSPNSIDIIHGWSQALEWVLSDEED